VSTFLGIISPRKCVGANIPTYVDPVIEAKNGANAVPAKAVKRYESASPGAVLEGTYGDGTTTD
jgi:hypothetical protein